MSTKPWYSLLPSLLTLVAVFYFINAACLSDSSNSDPERAIGSHPSGACTATPSMARVELLAPADNATVVGDEPGPVDVTVHVGSAGLTLVPASPQCVRGEGHFVVHAHRTAPACPPVVQDTTVELDEAEASTTLQLFPGIYQLNAIFVTNDSREYEPRLVATHLITVAGTLPDAGASPCQ